MRDVSHFSTQRVCPKPKMKMKLPSASGHHRASASSSWRVIESVCVNICRPFIIRLLPSLREVPLLLTSRLVFYPGPSGFCFPLSWLLASAAQWGIAFEWRPRPCVLLTVSEPCNYVILCLGFAPSPPSPQRPQSALAQSRIRKGWLDVSVSEQRLCTIIWSVWCATWPVPAWKVPYRGNSLESNKIILHLFWKKTNPCIASLACSTFERACLL